MYVRGNAADYDGWAAAGNPGWSWPDVIAAFRRSERNGRGATRHGADGPLSVEDLRDPSPLTLAFLRAATEAGIPASPDLNGASQDGVRIQRCRESTRQGGLIALRDGLRRRPVGLYGLGDWGCQFSQQVAAHNGPADGRRGCRRTRLVPR